MLPNIFAARVNLAIVFLGAAAIIFGIKLTPHLLPPQFYFSFSKLIGGGSEPFMVDPPAVAAEKLCTILDRNSISRDVFARTINCNEDAVASRDKEAHVQLSLGDVDRVYTIAIRTDPTLRAMLETAGRNVSVAPLSEQTLDEILKRSATVQRAFEEISDYYAAELGMRAREAVLPTVLTLYAQLQKDPKRVEPVDGGGEAVPQAPAISDLQRANIKTAHRTYLDSLKRRQSFLVATPLTKTALDGILKGHSATDDLAAKIADFYQSSVQSEIRKNVQATFEAQGLNVADATAEKQRVLGEILRESYVNYIISIVVRLLPVMVFGLILGFAFGKRELMSIATAGALSAFLLSWPLMLLWDRLVQSSWADKKPTFLTFYVLYIISYYFTARAAGVVGARFRGATTGASGAVPGDEPGEVASLTWREVVANIAGAAIINAMLYVWNAVIPFVAIGSR